MRPGNPACFECPKSEIHAWKRNADGTATCCNCDLVLNKSDADDALRVDPIYTRAREEEEAFARKLRAHREKP